MRSEHGSLRNFKQGLEQCAVSFRIYSNDLYCTIFCSICKVCEICQYPF